MAVGGQGRAVWFVRRHVGSVDKGSAAASVERYLAWLVIRLNSMLARARTLYHFMAKADAPLVTCGLVLAVIRGLCPSVSTILIGEIFGTFAKFSSNTVAAKPFLDEVRRYCAGLFALAAIGFVVNWLLYTVWSYLGNLQGHRLRLELFKAFVDAEIEELDRSETSEGHKSMLFKDVQDLERATGPDTMGVAVELVSLVSSLGVAFYYSWAVTLVCLAGAPIFAAIISLMIPRIDSKVETSKDMLDTISHRTSFILRSVQTVKLMQKESWEIASLAKCLAQYHKVTTRMWTLSEAQEGLARFLTLLMFVQGFYFGAYMVRQHGLGPGNVMTVFWSCVAAAGSAESIMQRVVELEKGLVSARRLLAFVLKKDEQKRKHKTIGIMHELEAAPAIEFRDVVFSYPTRPELIMRNLNLTVEGGTTTYIVGPSGSGKSSIAALLVKHYAYQAGQIHVGSHSLETLSDAWIGRTIQVLPQQTRLFDLTIAENIRMGHRDPQSISDELLQTAITEMGADFVYDLPQGLQTSGSYPLSGGQVQRICLVAAWLNDAPVLVLDESLSALEPDLQLNLLGRLLYARAGKTTAVITHNMEAVPDNEPLYFISNGSALYMPSKQALNSTRDLKVAGPYKELLMEAKRESWSHESSSKGVTSWSQRMTIYEEWNSVSTSEQTSVSSRKNPGIVRSNWVHTKMRAVSQSVRLLALIESKTLLFIGLTVVALHAVVNPIFAFVFSKLLLGLVPTEQVNVTLWAMMVLVCAFADGLLSFMKVILHCLTETWQSQIRVRLLERILSRHLNDGKYSHSYFKKLIMSDTEKVMEVINIYWAAIVNVVVLGLVGLIWALVEGWKLSLVGLSILPVILTVSYLYKVETTRWNSARESSRARLLRLVDDITVNLRVIKANRLETYFEKHYISREQCIWFISVRAAIWIGLGYGSIEIFTPIAQGLLLYYGMKLVSTGEYSESQTMMVFTLLVFTLVTLDGVLSSIPGVGSGFEAADRIYEIISPYEPAVEEDLPNLDEYGTQTPTHVSDLRRIRIDNLILSLHGLPVLQNLNMEVAAGTTCVIIGPSGSGKSTLMRVLTRLQRFSSGAIHLGEENLLDISLYRLRREIAVVEQAPLNFFDESIYKNLMYGAATVPTSEESLTAVHDACVRVGIHDFITSLEEGYDTVMRPGIFSGGQLQRLGIARALMRNPQILIMDEPTSALDVESVEVIKKLIRSLRVSGECTVVVITHQYDLIELADQTMSLFPPPSPENLDFRYKI